MVRVAALELTGIPLFTCLYTTPLLKVESGWHQAFWLSVGVRSCLARLQLRLMPVPALSTGDPGTFGPRCVRDRSVGLPESSAQESLPSCAVAGGAGYPGRDSLWQPRPILLVACLGDRCCFTWGEFRARCCCPASPALISIPGCPTGDTTLRLSCEPGAMRGAQGCPRRVSFLELKDVLARTGSPSGLAESSPFPLPGQRACGAAVSVACWAISRQEPGSLRSRA